MYLLDFVYCNPLCKFLYTSSSYLSFTTSVLSLEMHDLMFWIEKGDEIQNIQVLVSSKESSKRVIFIKKTKSGNGSGSKNYVRTNDKRVGTSQDPSTCRLQLTH